MSLRQPGHRNWNAARVLRTAVRASNADAICERWVRTECTDRLLIVNERHLRQIPTAPSVTATREEAAPTPRDAFAGPSSR